MTIEPYLQGVRTDSFWMASWLRYVKGYRLTSRRSVPKGTFFGKVLYDRWWVLVPPGDG